MARLIKTKRELSRMRRAGKILSQIVKRLVKKTKVGVSTYDLDCLAFDLCKKYRVKPAFLNYNGYPATGCFGVNDTVVHGIPSKNEILMNGDVISIDMGVILEKYFSDMAVTVGVGKISKSAQKLIDTTKNCLYTAIKYACDGNTIGNLGNAIQTVAELSGFSVVKQMVGHGIGKNLHEEPQIPGFGVPGEGMELKEGMTIAIEAIINQGDEGIRFLDDGWTTKTTDGKLSALFEHTVLVGRGKAEILTKY